MWAGVVPLRLVAGTPVVDAGVNYLIAYIPDVAYDHDRLHLYAEQIIPHIR